VARRPGHIWLSLPCRVLRPCSGLARTGAPLWSRPAHPEMLNKACSPPFRLKVRTTRLSPSVTRARVLAPGVGPDVPRVGESVD
jgi:hypothetical protein